MVCQIEEYDKDKQGIGIMVQYIMTPRRSKSYEWVNQIGGKLNTLT
jgi:hypothetical protein